MKYSSDKGPVANQMGNVYPMTGMQLPATTNVPPMPANTMGGSKPLFASSAEQMAKQYYGDVNDRQNSVNAPSAFQMSDQNGDGEITYGDIIKARVEGYKE
tara:strand:- start:196 stop:498 length:303 start_codon:yes stop_codon:yes gene_type:complete